MVVKSPKAAHAEDCRTLEQLPNIGPSLAADLRLIGIRRPQELVHRDAFALYQALCAKTGKRQDPCVLDTFMAATDFMRGAAPAPWWAYTPQRKQLYGQMGAASPSSSASASAGSTTAAHTTLTRRA